MKNLILFSFIILISPLFSQEIESEVQLRNILKMSKASAKIDSLEKFTKMMVFKDPALGMKAAKELKALSKGSNKISAFLTSYNALGLSALYLDKNDDAVLYFDTLVKLAAKREDTLFQGKAHGNLGLVYDRMANYKKAFEEYGLALKFSELSKNTSLMASSYGNMGNVSIRLKRCKEAIQYLEKSSALFSELGNKKSLANQYNSISQAYDCLSDDSMQKKYLKMSERLYREVGEYRALGTVLTNLGTMEEDLGNHRGAIKLLEEALSLKSSIEENNGAATVLVNLSNSYASLKQIDKAYDCIRRAEKIAEEQNDLFLKSEILKKRALLLRMQGKYSEAYDVILSYLTVNDSLIGQQTQDAVAEYKEKYESEKKEYEIDRLTKAEEIGKLRIKQNEIELSKEKAQRNLIIGALVFIVVLFVVMTWFFIQKRKSSRVLEIKNKQLEKANNAIIRQKEEILEKQKEILDSIHYAKRIQTALMSNEKYITRILIELQKK